MLILFMIVFLNDTFSNIFKDVYIIPVVYMWQRGNELEFIDALYSIGNLLSF